MTRAEMIQAEYSSVIIYPDPNVKSTYRVYANRNGETREIWAFNYLGEAEVFSRLLISDPAEAFNYRDYIAKGAL